MKIEKLWKWLVGIDSGIKVIECRCKDNLTLACRYDSNEEYINSPLTYNYTTTNKLNWMTYSNHIFDPYNINKINKRSLG